MKDVVAAFPAKAGSSVPGNPPRCVAIPGFGAETGSDVEESFP